MGSYITYSSFLMFLSYLEIQLLNYFLPYIFPVFFFFFSLCEASQLSNSQTLQGLMLAPTCRPPAYARSAS